MRKQMTGRSTPVVSTYWSVANSSGGGLERIVDKQEDLFLSSYGSLPGSLKRVTKNYAIFAALTPVLIAVLNLLIISGGDAATVVTLVSVVSVKVIVLSAVVHVLPTVACPVLPLFVTYSHYRARADLENRSTWRFLEVLFIALTIALAFFATLFIVVLLFLVATFSVVFFRPIDRAIRRRVTASGTVDNGSEPAKIGGTLGAFERFWPQFSVVVVGVWVSASTLSLAAANPFPVELVHAKGGNTRVADVVGRDGGSVTFLYTGTSYVQRVAVSNIVSENFCEMPALFIDDNIAYLLDNRRGNHVVECPGV